MDRRSTRRVFRGVLAAAALGIVVYQYFTAGFSGSSVLFGIVGVVFAYQAATGAG